MSELLWPMYHDLRKRVEAVEMWLGQTDPDWNKPPEPVQPEPTQDDTQTDPQDDNAPPEVA